jgi:hypothetical protein
VTQPDPFAAVAALPTVAAAAAAARAAVDTALAHNLMRRRSAEVSVEAGLRSARATASLEGAEFGLADVRAFATGHDGSLAPDNAVLGGALRLSAELGTVRGAFEHAPLQAFARLHMLAAADVVKADRLGRPRSDTDDSEVLLGLPLAPSPTETSARLSLLADLLVAKTTAPALVVSALVHGELLALRPFVWGNGLVARAAARLVLVTRGLDVKAVTAPEVGHADDPSAYRHAAAAYVGGDVAAWLEHCARAVEIGARETLAICAAIERTG